MSIERDLRAEIKRAESRFPPYKSPHEGYAVIAEELDELWDEIKMHKQNKSKMYNEALQVACTAIRFCKMLENK